MFKRDLAHSIIDSARYFSVIGILGPRQSGKTTLAQMIFKKHVYVTLEDLDLRTAALKDPRTFLLANMNEHGIIIDEFQYVPELLSYIQTIVDKEKKKGFFILTGSQNFLMNKAISQSLAGRIAIHTLLPLSIHELSTIKELPEDIEPMLYQGCYPAIYSEQTPPDKLYKNYLRTYIERDVRSLSQIGDLNTFQTFLAMCAARVGQLLNLTSLANDCGISDNTAKRWISILEASYIIFLLRPYHNNFGKRLVKTPKLYFYDTGIMCNLLRLQEKEIALHPAKGALFESFILSQILKWYYNHDKTPNIYFWRDSHGNEIDCIIEDGSKLIPIELKAGRTTLPRFFEGIEYWNELPGKKTTKGYVIYGGSKKQSRGYENIISWQSLDDILK